MAGTMLITGGCRSGKSLYAQRLSENAGKRRLFIATAPVLDEEMRRRVAQHREMRRERGWETREEKISKSAFMDGLKSIDKELYELIETKFDVTLIKQDVLDRITQKKKYALLQIQYWLNTIKLRERCNASINTVLYFYSQFDPNVRLQQNIQSRVLVDLIHDCKGKLITFPLPIDLDIASVEILKRRFNVTKAPSLVINETVVLEGLQSRQTLEKYIIC